MRTLVLTLCVFVPLCAQQPPAHDGQKPHGPPEPKNLKILKIPASELMPVMMIFSASLGVKCVFCHVENDFASDEKPEKETARMMIAMVHEINAKFPDGKMHVGCFTCHRGDKEPKVTPPVRKPPAQ